MPKARHIKSDRDESWHDCPATSRIFKQHHLYIFVHVLWKGMMIVKYVKYTSYQYTKNKTGQFSRYQNSDNIVVLHAYGENKVH